MLIGLILLNESVKRRESDMVCIQSIKQYLILKDTQWNEGLYLIVVLAMLRCLCFVERTNGRERIEKETRCSWLRCGCGFGIDVVF